MKMLFLNALLFFFLFRINLNIHLIIKIRIKIVACVIKSIYICIVIDNKRAFLNAFFAIKVDQLWNCYQLTEKNKNSIN